MSITTFSLPVPAYFFPQLNATHSIYIKKSISNLCILRGRDVEPGDYFIWNQFQLLSHLSGCFVKEKLKVHVWVVTDSFWGKMKMYNMLQGCVCISAFIWRWVYVYHDSQKLAGSQAPAALPLTPPLNPPLPWSGLGSISNFLELISLQQEGGHCLICPKDIIKH